MQQCHKSWPPDEVKCRKLVVVTFSLAKCDISVHNFIRTGKIIFICRNSKHNLSENILKIAFLRWKYNHHLHMFHKIIGTIFDQNCSSNCSKCPQIRSERIIFTLWSLRISLSGKIINIWVEPQVGISLLQYATSTQKCHSPLTPSCSHPHRQSSTTVGSYGDPFTPG